jgi:thiosulfate/3-mercaptopyruvate sulfurtransferase
MVTIATLTQRKKELRITNSRTKMGGKVIMVANYWNPNVLVETQWVYDHLNDSHVRIAEVDFNPTSNYDLGHIPGAFLFDWKKDLNDSSYRDIISKKKCEDLLRGAGVNNDTLLVLYGDYKNWFATFAFWVFKYYGLRDIGIMNGGRKKWFQEDRPLSMEIPSYPPGNFKASSPDNSIRVYMSYLKKRAHSKNKLLVDVRSEDEFTGKLLAPAEYPSEHAQRGGHIPGSVNIPWNQVVNEDGTFKSADEIKGIYDSKGVTPEKEVITYCRIGERSSHTWFVLKYLLGYPNVKIYDGSWTEWGNIIRNPVEK